MNQVSIFKNFTTIIAERTVAQIITTIRGKHYKSQVIAIRKAIENNDFKRRDFLKKQLHAFTISGKFEYGRTLDKLVAYRPFVVLDIDKLTLEEVRKVREQGKQIPFTLAGFVSPSGRGYKFIIRTTATLNTHTKVFKAVANYYEQKLRLPVDQSGKDVTRLCFLSHDPTAYYNSDAAIFEVEKISKTAMGMLAKPSENYQSSFEECITRTNQQSNYIDGNRNNYMFQLASNCNRAGIPMEVVMALSRQKFDLSNPEIERTISSSFKGYRPDVTPKITALNGHHSDYFHATPPPFIPEKVFDKLPGLLAEACATFKDKRERDVFLTGALGLLSACLPQTQGIYDRRLIYPNLYTFIIAPSASGKGMLTFAKELGMPRHNQLLSKSRKAKKEHKVELKKFELSLYNYRKGKVSDPPKEPNAEPLKVLFIPANSSSAMLIRQLYNNNSQGILFETEADTLANVLKQDWGGYSDILRKAAHHEAISYSRKLNDEFVEITTPRLSVVLSGTPNQVISLIPSVEDGLFSRFLFYFFEVDVKWRDVSPDGAYGNFQEVYKKRSTEVLTMTTFLEKYPTNFGLRKDQWALLNDHFSKTLEKINKQVGKGAVSIVKRSGLTLFRIAMILSTLRKFEKQNTQKNITCNNDDFHTALSIVETYIEHALSLYDLLPHKERSSLNGLSERKKQFYQQLPHQFKRKEAIEKGKSFGLSERTIDRLLKKLCGQLLQQKDYGVYEKI